VSHIIVLWRWHWYCDCSVVVGGKVLRKQSFEEKYQYRTGSPASSDVAVSSSSRSDSPSLPFWDLPINSAVTGYQFQAPNTQSLYANTNLDLFSLYQHTGQDQPSLIRDSGGLVPPGNGFVSPVTRYVPCTSVVTRMRPAIVASGRPVSGPPRGSCSVAAGLKSSPGPPLAAASNGLTLTGLYTSANASQPAIQPYYATGPEARMHGSNCGSDTRPTPSSYASDPRLPGGYGPDCRQPPALNPNLVSKPVASWSTKQPPIMLHQVHSIEVTWPTAQKATSPSSRQETENSVSSRELSQPPRDISNPQSGSIDISRLTAVTVACSTMTFCSPPDVSLPRDNISRSPSQLSSGSSTLSTTNSSDVSATPPALPDKPPPPYPGRAPLRNTPLRQAPPPPPTEPAPVIIIDELGAAECQHHESPRPVRRPQDCNRDYTEFSETKVVYTTSLTCSLV